MAGMSAKGPYVHSSEEAKIMACRKRLNSPWKQVLLGLLLKGIA